MVRKVAAKMGMDESHTAEAESFAYIAAADRRKIIWGDHQGANELYKKSLEPMSRVSHYETPSLPDSTPQQK